MLIITKSLHVINYQLDEIFPREISESFREYVLELVDHIRNNPSVRAYKSTSTTTEVIRCALDILENKDSDDIISTRTENISKRLLSKEQEAQRRVERLSTNIQKGSLIQALIQDEANDNTYYLLAKVDHSEFVDDDTFTFKSGFSKDKKNIWKSCLLDISNTDTDIFYAKVYTNNSAKYWSEGFLELVPIESNESNTIKAFKSIDGLLGATIKKTAPSDYTVIRNSVISYFKNVDHFDYSDMLETLIRNYDPTELSRDDLSSLIGKFEGLPEKKKFDRQFSPVPSAIKAHIKKIYEVNSGIKLQVTDEVDDIRNTITAFVDGDTGQQYLRIKVTNQDTFNMFKNNN